MLAKATKAKAKPEMIRFTTYLPKSLAEGFRDASYWLRVPLTDLVSEALRRDLARLEKANGGAFKAKARPLAAGRALRSS